MGTYAIGITGASGAPYARTILSELLQTGHRVFAVMSHSGRKVLDVECGISLTGNTEADLDPMLEWIGSPNAGDRLTLLHHEDVAAPIASGSYPTNGMAVVPCSGGTLGRIANGISGGLIERAADVCLKERRRLVLVPSRDAAQPDPLAKYDSRRRSGRSGASRKPRVLPLPAYGAGSCRHRSRTRPSPPRRRIAAAKAVAGPATNP